MTGQPQTICTRLKIPLWGNSTACFWVSKPIGHQLCPELGLCSFWRYCGCSWAPGPPQPLLLSFVPPRLLGWELRYCVLYSVRPIFRTLRWGHLQSTVWPVEGSSTQNFPLALLIAIMGGGSQPSTSVPSVPLPTLSFFLGGSHLEKIFSMFPPWPWHPVARKEAWQQQWCSLDPTSSFRRLEAAVLSPRPGARRCLARAGGWEAGRCPPHRL